MTRAGPLDELVRLIGIERDYIDQDGHRQQVPEATIRALLATLGYPADTEEQAASALAALRRRSTEAMMPPVTVARAERGQPALPITLPAPTGGAVIAWQVREEGGRVHRGEAPFSSLSVVETLEADGGQYERRHLLLPVSLPLGYHSAQVQVAGARQRTAETLLIAVPAHAYCPKSLETGGGIWGLAVQLYSLRSTRNWGIGDFTDLAAFIRHAAAAGAGAVGLNPLHALYPDEPERASPYAPSSRRFLNTLYLDVEAIEDFAECDEARGLVGAAAFQERLQQLRIASLIDYAGVAWCKHRILAVLHAHFAKRHLASISSRAESFRQFQQRCGDDLRHLAIFQALREQMAADDPTRRHWRHWPPELQDPRSRAVADFARTRADRIQYFEYVQWQADLQLRACAGTARAAGMPIGLYHDLAVGVDAGSADAWGRQDIIVDGWSIGAPPDAWNLKGQSWGLSPFDPGALQRRGYDAFIALLRANMQHAAALRVDHVLGLWRLFWVPLGQPPAAGVYLRYPFDDLVGILALESHRNRCLVIGEDLGTLPDGLRAKLAQSSILSYRLLYFEREPDGSFRRPDGYPRQSLVAVSTHDLPTLPGYWAGADIDLRERLDLFPSSERQHREREARPLDRRLLAAALRAEGLAGAAEPKTAPVEAIYRFLARTPARLLLVHVDDPLGIQDQVNMPGTTEEHPNWRRRLPLAIDELFRDARVKQLFAALNEERPPLHLPEPAAPKATDAWASDLAVPRATYRLQLGTAFGFADAAEIVPYLAALGISHLYASPFLKARPGSTHGYDIIDHNALNPEIGTPEAFERLCQALRQHDMGLILDFVPNHMGIGESDNEWWLDLLEWGQNSVYADFFDIDWAPRQRQLAGKVLVPVLGDHYGAALERGELVLRFDGDAGSFSVWYHEHRLPIRPRHHAIIIHRHLAQPSAAAMLDQSARSALESLAAAFDKLRRPERRQRSALRERARALQAELAQLCRNEPAVARFIETATEAFNGRLGEPKSFRPLHLLLERQAYRLAYWRVAADEINYRRFFNINELAGIRMENAALFEIAHQLVARLIAAGQVHGIRLDHIDGLFDPQGYCERLRALALRNRPRTTRGATDPPFHIVVEKILARHESLRHAWPITGTTGYEFANLVNGLFVDPAGQRRLERAYRAFVGPLPTFDETVAAAKSFVIDNMLASELNVLAHDLDRISERHWGTRDYTNERLRAALKEIVAHFPVYRTYVTGKGATAEDRRDIDWAVGQAKRQWRGPDPEILEFVRAALTTDLARSGGPYARADVVRFAMKLQQYTGPVMAKSLEDTAFYRHNLLLSLNEVGGDPRQFGVSPAAFHHANRLRLRQWPNTMLATATHDTKRGEDARVRIDVLSEMADAWGRHVRRWAMLNRSQRHEVDGMPAPSRNDEYMIYQAMVGAWPTALVGVSQPDADDLQAFAERMTPFVVKAVREAKLATSWDNPNPAYEDACAAFVQRLLVVSRPNPFLADFILFQEKVAHFGMLNGLSQTVLKLTAPGVPDTYQGTELWDLSFVDPDNRRAVDFAGRRRLLGELHRSSALDAAENLTPARALLVGWRDARIKLYLMHGLLQLRARHAALFREGSYEPLQVTGDRADHLVAFLRSYRDQRLIVVAGRLFARLLGEDASAYTGGSAWDDTAILCPDDAVSWKNVLTGESIACRSDPAALPASTLLAALPVAVLIAPEA